MKKTKDLARLLQISVLLLVALSAGLSFGCEVGQDKEAAETLAARIHTQMRSRDFAGVYNQSASGFRTVSEAEFVSDMTEIQNKLGQITDVKAVAYQTGLDTKAGRTHTLIFAVRYDRGRVRETLVFVRGDNNEMQLWKLGIEPIN
jgi:hypothetical protein